MTEREAQIKVCSIMYKLRPKGNDVFMPSPNGIESDLDFLSILVSHTMLDLEAKVREAKTKRK